MAALPHVISAPIAAVDDDASLLSPEIAGRLGRLALVARKMAAARQAGRRRTRRVGSGIETIDLRAYDVGDDPRRIAWHAYARLERLLVRLVADEAPLRLGIVVDQSASMGFGTPTKLRQAARIAAGFAAVALGGEDRVAVASGSAGEANVLRPVSGSMALPRVLAALDTLAAVGTTDLPAAVRKAAEASKGRGVCLIVSDLFEPQGVLASAREARLRGNEVAIVEVLAPFEIEPPDLSGFEVEDEETGEIVELPPSGARAQFAAALRRHREAIDEAARDMGAVVLRATTAESFEGVVMRAIAAGLVGGSR